MEIPNKVQIKKPLVGNEGQLLPLEKSKLPGQAAKIWERISKVSIYFLVFLLPLFFLPWTADLLDFNKQALLIFLVMISLISWLLKSLTEGKINLNFNLLHLPVIIFLVVLGIATIFSSYSYGSFWGWPLNIAQSFLTIFGFVLLYFFI